MTAASLCSTCGEHIQANPTAEISVVCCYVQIINDIERTKNDIAAAEKRQQEIASQVQQAKQGKEDSVSNAATHHVKDI
jgi:hypothetical protein